MWSDRCLNQNSFSIDLEHRVLIYSLSKLKTIDGKIIESINDDIDGILLFLSNTRIGIHNIIVRIIDLLSWFLTH